MAWYMDSFTFLPLLNSWCNQYVACNGLQDDRNEINFFLMGPTEAEQKDIQFLKCCLQKLQMMDSLKIIVMSVAVKY
jgi:hypothetical protein